MFKIDQGNAFLEGFKCLLDVEFAFWEDVDALPLFQVLNRLGNNLLAILFFQCLDLLGPPKKRANHRNAESRPDHHMQVIMG
ncbi:hypothetical protein SDC9_131288 [bioreactor metagenome]|uniref:Uncharacterized protein n=1 Tax=bioreactor metagenome TaxID=1076179 RepID=A0A645D4U2_9ZZZZ